MSQTARTIKQDAKEKLWQMGVLSFKLHSGQKELYNLYYNSPHKIQTWLISRRFGKSYCLCVLALEQCIRKPNSIVKFVSPTKLQVNTYVRPLFREILKDCPVDLVPDFNQKDYIYYFSNGSEIQLAGSDGGHAEKLRGGSSHLAFIDEAGTCDDLDNTVKSILLPTTLTTNGKIIMAGTPSKEPDHEFHGFVETADSRGSLIRKTIYENPLLTKAQVQEITEEHGGTASDEFRREYLVEIIRDPKTLVVPEFTPELEKEIVVEWQRPPHFDMYEAMDLGFKDLTVNLIGYYDFRNNKVVIEDEVVVDFKVIGVTIETLIKNIENSEKDHFYNVLTSEQKLPTKRVSDTDLIVLNEIQKKSNYSMNFEVIKKDNLDAMVNFLREKIKRKEVIINPRCKTLIRHLRNVKWKKGDKSMFARSPEDSHYDAAAALTYFIRAIDYRKNPYPAHWGNSQQDLFGNYIIEKPKVPKFNMDIYKQILNVKPNKKR